jgi:phosphoribosylaminoimidazole-succinocarboxamide synthase
MEKRDKIYEGKAKIVYTTDKPGLVIQYFKDDATAFNALKRGTILGKGVVNNRMSAMLFERLGKARIPTHYVSTLSDREMLCRRLDIIKIETIVRNVVAGSLAKRTGLPEGTPVRPPIVELYLKSDPLGDPMINDDHVRMLKLASPKEVAWIRRAALQINAVLRPYLARKALLLVDFKLEFGRAGGKLMLGDEISPDTAGCGTRRRGRSSTRTGSARTSAGWRKRIRKSTVGSRRESESARSGPSQDGHPRRAGDLGEAGARGPRFRRGA